MTEKIQRFDWEATPLGALARWPGPLRSAVDSLLASSLPQCAAWGPQMTALYNDAFAEVLRGHALHLGLPFYEIWQEAWTAIGPLAHRAYHGRSTLVEDFRLLIERDGVPKELTSPSAPAPCATSTASCAAC